MSEGERFEPARTMPLTVVTYKDGRGVLLFSVPKLDLAEKHFIGALGHVAPEIVRDDGVTTR